MRRANRPVTIADVLRRAASILMKRKVYRGMGHPDMNGNQTCAYHAINLAGEQLHADHRLQNAAKEALRSVIGAKFLVRWTNTTSKRKMLTAFRAAAKLSEKDEANA